MFRVINQELLIIVFFMVSSCTAIGKSTLSGDFGGQLIIEWK